MAIQFRPLGNENRAAFSCGQEALDQWFHLRAGQEQRNKVAQVFVAHDDKLGIVGFYSLSAFSIVAADLPQELVRKPPRYDTIPAVLVVRMARDLRVRGTGMGAALMGDAITRIVAASAEMGIYAIVVDAKTPELAKYCQDYGFIPFPSQPLRLFLPLATAVKSLDRATQS